MQQFQILTKENKIVLIRPYNPFAQGVVERINAVPVEGQAAIMQEAFVTSGVTGQLSILSFNNIQAINVERDVIIYSLIIEK